MRTQLYRYQPRLGWDTQPVSALGSNKTLVLFFCGSFGEFPPSLFAVLKIYIPKALLAGRTTAGDNHDTGVSDESLVVIAGGLTGDASPLYDAVSRIGRQLVQGQRTKDEIETVMEPLPPGIQQIWHCSHGEISPLANGERELHNQTATLTVLQET